MGLPLQLAGDFVGRLAPATRRDVCDHIAMAAVYVDEFYAFAGRGGRRRIRIRALLSRLAAGKFCWGVVNRVAHVDVHIAGGIGGAGVYDAEKRKEEIDRSGVRQ